MKLAFAPEADFSSSWHNFRLFVKYAVSQKCYSFVSL